MANAIYLSSIGVKMFYAVEATAGTRPSAKADYTELEGIKSTPSMNPTPDDLDTTTLNETEYKTSIPGLKDLGGALSFTFNMSNTLMTAWETLMTSYATAAASSKKTWFYIEIPGLENGLFFPGIPSPMGTPELSVNSVIEIENYITPIGAPIYAAKPTA